MPEQRWEAVDCMECAKVSIARRLGDRTPPPTAALT